MATWAGIDRDRLQAARGKPIAGIQTGRLFWLGLFFCIFNGVASAMLNIGYTCRRADRPGGHPAGSAICLPAGPRGPARNASIVRWVVLFWGGVDRQRRPTSCFCWSRTRVIGSYCARGAAKAYFWALATAACGSWPWRFTGKARGADGEWGRSSAGPCSLALARWSSATPGASWAASGRTRRGPGTSCSSETPCWSPPRSCWVYANALRIAVRRRGAVAYGGTN